MSALEELQEHIRSAAAHGEALRFRGGGTKDFFGNEPRGRIVETAGYTGVVNYEPTELVVTARCGTGIAPLEELLRAQGQCLPFEPPHFGEAATLGGCVAAGLSGPRRASAGALRDFVLGVRLIDGRGRLLSFGGEVMKNVAGYDVSRLLAGSLGTLGLIAEVSLKVLPLPAVERTVCFELPQARALEVTNRWAGQPLPISATAWCDARLSVRLSGSAEGVKLALAKIGGETLDEAQAAAFWYGLREHTDAFFAGAEPLWRLAVPSVHPPLEVEAPVLLEWSGGQRWLRTAADAAQVRELARSAGGHATLFRASSKPAGAFAPLGEASARLHRALKNTFDPAGILNPGRMYAEL